MKKKEEMDNGFVFFELNHVSFKFFSQYQKTKNTAIFVLLALVVKVGQ